MKHIFYLFIVLAFFSCKNESAKPVKTPKQAAADSANYTSVVYLDSAQNVGVLTMGEQIEISFDLKNSGEKPLYIISAEPSCGCTVADFPKDPLAPDSLGKIVDVFDTNKSSVGDFTKVITVITNTKPSSSHVLTFSGEVISKGGEEKHEHTEPAEAPKAEKTN